MADISFTTTAVQFTDAESFLTTNRTAGTTLAAGDFVVLDSANQWILGDVNSGTLEVTGSNGFGIALNPAALNQPVKVVTEDGAEIDFGEINYSFCSDGCDFRVIVNDVLTPPILASMPPGWPASPVEQDPLPAGVEAWLASGDT